MSTTSRPNILLITTDQQRYETYGLEDSDWPVLPNLRRLRRESTTLTNAYSNSPVCMPCRHTWLTGLYGTQCERGPKNAYDWPDNLPTMPQALRRAGYYTALIGKLHGYCGYTLEQHHLDDLTPHSRQWGFDHVRQYAGRSLWSFQCHKKRPTVQDRYTDHLRERGLYEAALAENTDREKQRAAHNGQEPYRPGVLAAEDTLDGFLFPGMRRFLEDHDREQPFFLHASFFGPHYPLDVPKEYFELYRPEAMPAPHHLEDPHEIQRWRENRAMYMGLATLVDERIGALLETLDAQGLRENTVVLFTTDHGDMLGDRGYVQKSLPHEGACRTPILVRAPGHCPEGVIREGLVEAADLPQTILEIAGLDASERAAALPKAPGQSFWDYACHGGDGFRDSVYAEIHDDGRPATMRMIRRGDRKYARWADGGEVLFDLARDPHELKNLAADPAHEAERSELRGQLIDRMARIPTAPMQGALRGEELGRRLGLTPRA